MSDSRQLLSMLNRTIQINRLWLRSAIRQATGPDFTSVLRCFLQELEWIETEARHAAFQRGWEPELLSPVQCALHSRRFRRSSSNASIAGQLILLCTKARIQILGLSGQELHNCLILSLLQQLTDTYAVTIRKLERFL